MKDEIGVFVAPVNTPTSPSAATNEGSICIKFDKVFPKVEPITNKGVTSSPWKPVPKVNDVNIIFPKKQIDQHS